MTQPTDDQLRDELDRRATEIRSLARIMGHVLKNHGGSDYRRMLCSRCGVFLGMFVRQHTISLNNPNSVRRLQLPCSGALDTYPYRKSTT